MNVRQWVECSNSESLWRLHLNTKKWARHRWQVYCVAIVHFALRSFIVTSSLFPGFICCDWLIDDWLTDWVIKWMNEWLIDYLISLLVQLSTYFPWIQAWPTFKVIFSRYHSPILFLLLFIPPLRDTSVLSRLRTATRFPRPVSRTKNIAPLLITP